MFPKEIKIAMITLGLLITSCAPTLPIIKKKSDLKESIPPSFPTFGEKEAQEIINLQRWDSYFKNKQLKILISTALKNNLELGITTQETHIANNEIMEKEGEYLPKLGFGATYEREKVGEYTSQGASDASTYYAPNKKVPEILDNKRIGLFSSWEIDIWKKLRNASKSAYYRYLASQEAQRYITTKIVSEVANTYFELLSLDSQLKLVNNYISILNEAQELLALQLNAGKVTSLAVKRFEAEVLKNKSFKYKIRQKIVETENRLNNLVGRFPQKIDRSTEDLLSLKLTSLQGKIPTDLLDNRPDIKESLMQLESAKLNVKVAKARFYPSLSIEAGGGYEGFNTSHLYHSPQSVFYNIGANLTAPLLNRKAIKADYFSSNNRQIQAIYEYEKTLLRAFTEVSNLLSKIENTNQELDLKTLQVSALNKSAEISKVLFYNARVDYVEALITQRDSLEAQVDLIEVKKEQLISQVSLYRALGGGWK